MASSASPNPNLSAPKPETARGFFANAIKHKHSFIQFFAMTGILLLSVRSLGQKYRINDLLEDTASLKEERRYLADRTTSIKQGLLNEASLEPTGLFASRLRLLFADLDN